MTNDHASRCHPTNQDCSTLNAEASADEKSESLPQTIQDPTSPSETKEMIEESAKSTKLSTWTIVHMVLVVIASSTINGVVFGVVNNFGVFYVYLIKLFKENRGLFAWNDYDASSAAVNSTSDWLSEPLIGMYKHSVNFEQLMSFVVIAGVGSVNIGLIFFCSIFASVLSDRYGIRTVCFVGGALSTIGMYASSVSINIIYLYITYGLVLGIGASLVYAPSLAILGHYFTSCLGVINGLVTAGSSLFSIMMPIILRHLIDKNGVQTTFKYLSCLMVVLMLCALTFKEKINKSKPVRRFGSKSSISSVFFYALWKNKPYVCWLISIPLGLFGYFIIFCHLPNHAIDIQSVYRGEILVMVIGIFSLIGRLISGPVSDFLHVDRIILQQIAFSSIGILTMTLATNVQGNSLLAVCAGLGLFDGFFISLLGNYRHFLHIFLTACFLPGPIAFDLVGPECANQAIGLLLCFCSLPLTVGPPIAG